MKNNTEIYVNMFCKYIDRLLESWETAGDNNYTMSPFMLGNKANYLAIIMGLTKLNNELPFNKNKWFWDSTPKGAKEKYPEVPHELREWKQKANQIRPDIKVSVPPLKTNITKEKIEKFCRIAEDTLDIQRISNPQSNIYVQVHGLSDKGKLLNELAIELGLPDAAWYLAYQLGISMNYGAFVKNEDEILEIYRELSIDPDCPKLPFVITDGFGANGIILEKELQILVAKAKARLEYLPLEKRKIEKSSFMTSSEENWEAIKSDFDISKKNFGKKINFVSDSFKRSIIFRDIEHAFVLASQGFSKPAIILAGGVIEELLRLYLKNKNIKPASDNFDGYIKTCEKEGLLKSGISRLSDSVRHFRNLVHLAKEETKRHTISKATAKGAVASIFTIANDFQ